MNLPDIEALVAVADTGSLNRAAAKLNITQPAISRRIQALEGRLGVLLLDRSSKPPKLSVEGGLAVEHGRKMLSTASDLSSLLMPKNRFRGDIRLGVAPGLADAALGAPFDAVIREFPNLNLRITSDWSRNLIDGLANGQLDAALLLTTDRELLERKFRYRAFRSHEVVVVGSRETSFTQPQTIAALGSHPWILNPLGCVFRDALRKALDREQRHLNICAEVANYELQLSLVTRGVGLGLIPSNRVRASSLRKKIKVVAVRDFSLTATPALVTAHETRFAPVMELLSRKLDASNGKKGAYLA